LNIKLKLFVYLILISASSLSFADDTDVDGIDDSIDNCVSVSNTDQLDTDWDGIGNTCDADDDGDGVSDSSDVWPLDYRYSLDSDSDGLPDAYEDANILNKYVASDVASDLDNDGLTVLEEFIYGTSDNNTDSDSDWLPDQWEVLNDRDPLTSDYPSSFSYHGCIIDDQDIKCIESNGYGSIMSFSHPNLVRPKAIAFGWGVGTSSNSAGQRLYVGGRLCVIDQNKLICWSQRIATNPDGSRYQSHVLEDEILLNQPSELAMYGDTKCVVDGQDVICFGNEWTPDLTGTRTFKNPRNLKQFSSGYCVTTDLGLKCWGEGYNSSSLENLVVPDEYEERFFSTNMIDYVSMGTEVYCGLDDIGIFCWATYDSRHLNRLISVPELISPYSISAKENRICALDLNGLNCWGNYGVDSSYLELKNALNNPKEVFLTAYVTFVTDASGLLCNCSGNVVRPNIHIDPDGDGYSNQGGADAFPLDSTEWLDTDSDGMGNNADPDDDNDSILDIDDAFPFDASESADTDDDGVGDNADAFPTDANETLDSDLDNVGDNADNCVDVKNTDQLDTDNDSLGNACDDDDDNDGITDEYDALPLDTSEQIDTDADGIGNNADDDDDNDGVIDNSDVYPLNNLYSADSDGDGMADAWELLYGLDPNDPSDASSDTDYDGAVALQEFIEGTIPAGSLDIDGNGQYDALTDGLLLLRGMFGLDGSALVAETIASDAVYRESVDIEARITTLGDLADIDGNGDIDALTDGLLTLRYLFGLRGDTLINGVVAGNSTRKTAEEIEAHLETLMPAL
jgi:hypothetical protein